MKKETWQDNLNKKVPDFCIWMLYNKTVQWLLLLNIPYFIIFAPIVDYVSFRYMYHVMKNWYISSDSGAADINHFLIILMNLTFLY